MLACNFCEKKFATKCNLTRHSKEVHDNMKRTAAGGKKSTMAAPKEVAESSKKTVSISEKVAMEMFFNIARENVSSPDQFFNAAMNTTAKVSGANISKAFVNCALEEIELKIGEKAGKQKDAKEVYRLFEKSRREQGRPPFTAEEKEILESIKDNINESATYWENFHQFILAQLYMLEVKLSQFNYEQTAFERMKTFWNEKLQQLNADEEAQILKKARKQSELELLKQEVEALQYAVEELEDTNESQFCEDFSLDF
jgi:hypothetical protein